MTPQLSVLLPVLLMVTVWAGGLLLPWIAVNARLVGVALMAGGTGAAVTVKETGIVTGVTPVPPLRMTEPVWVPGAKAPVVACKVTVPLPLPVPALRVNQPVFSLAVQVKVPPPVLRMTECLRGGVTAPLDGGEREARGTRADGRWHGCRRDSEGDGDGDRGVAPLGHSVTWPL